MVDNSKINGNKVIEKYNIADLEYQCSLYKKGTTKFPKAVIFFLSLR